MNTTFGKHLDDTGIFNGITKKANYVPGFSDEMKAEFKAKTRPGPNLCDRHSDQERCRVVGVGSGDADDHDEGTY